MTNLNTLLKNISIKASLYEEDKPITSVCFDSRKVEKGSMFVAISGTQSKPLAVGQPLSSVSNYPNCSSLM